MRQDLQLSHAAHHWLDVLSFEGSAWRQMTGDAWLMRNALSPRPAVLLRSVQQSR
jgi:hypothetical protein